MVCGHLFCDLTGRAFAYLAVRNRLTSECRHDSPFKRRDSGKLAQNKAIVKHELYGGMESHIWQSPMESGFVAH